MGRRRRALTLAASFAAVGGCGGQDNPNTGASAGGETGMGGIESFGDTGTRLDVGSGAGNSGGCAEGGGGGGELDFSFIWIANSEQGTVSKIDTRTGVELGRYYTGPAEGGSDPSRTSVNLLGDVAVTVREPGGMTKIAAVEERCVDKDGDNQITTSTGPNDILPWGTDECVLWQIDIPSADQFSGPRPTAWEGGADPAGGCTDNPRVWTGYLRDDGRGEFWRIDGNTGTVLDVVEGPTYINRPYGGAVNAQGDFFVTGWQADPAIKIDGTTLDITDYGNPGVEFYGMALDASGDLWTADRSDTARFAHLDPGTGTWTVVDGGGGKTRGIMVDRNGFAWAAGNNPCRLEKIDTAGEKVVDGGITLPGCDQPVGISIDIDGFVWVVDKNANQAYKVNPASHAIELTVTGLVGPYTYSDMTGAGLRLVINPPG